MKFNINIYNWFFGEGVRKRATAEKTLLPHTAEINRGLEGQVWETTHALQDMTDEHAVIRGVEKGVLPPQRIITPLNRDVMKNSLKNFAENAGRRKYAELKETGIAVGALDDNGDITEEAIDTIMTSYVKFLARRATRLLKMVRLASKELYKEVYNSLPKPE